MSQVFFKLVVATNVVKFNTFMPVVFKKENKYELIKFHYTCSSKLFRRLLKMYKSVNIVQVCKAFTALVTGGTC